MDEDDDKRLPFNEDEEFGTAMFILIVAVLAAVYILVKGG